MRTNILPTNMTLPDIVKFLRGGQIPITMFTLPMMALAMYHTAKPEQKAKIKPLLITGVFTSIIAGVTEPLEFTFLFISFVVLRLLYNQRPELYAVLYVPESGWWNGSKYYRPCSVWFFTAGVKILDQYSDRRRDVWRRLPAVPLVDRPF